jgi:hypothetical protein
VSTNGNQGVLVRPRLAFEDGFTMLPNTWIRDRRIKWAARAMLAWLLSHDAGFEVSMELLAKSGELGRDGVRATVQQLEKFGYLERKQRRDARGRIARTDWHLRDPYAESHNQLLGLEETQNPRSEPAPGLPSPGEPSPGEPSPVNPTTIENYLQEELSIDTSNRELLDAPAREPQDLSGTFMEQQRAAYTAAVAASHTQKPAFGVQPAPKIARYVPEPEQPRPKPRTPEQAAEAAALGTIQCTAQPRFTHLFPIGIDECVRGCGTTLTRTETPA